MSLHCYDVDLSELSQEERVALVDRLEKRSWTGFHWHPDFHGGQFFINANYDINQLKVPDVCHLTRIG